MKAYVQINPAEKLKLLQQHSIGTNWESLEQTKWCLHCDAQFTGHSVRVFKEDGEVWLECGSPDCDGSPLDWADYPWWDENHPETKARDEAMENLSDGAESEYPERN